MAQDYDCIVVDTHVHLYPVFDIDAALRAGWENLDRLARNAGKYHPLVVLFVLDRADIPDLPQQLNRSKDWASRELNGTTVEMSAGERRMLIVRGCQYATAERLEVLALGTTVAPRDGLPIEEVLQSARNTSRAVVIPWSPGKWWGKRRAVVSGVLRADDIFRGDISIRSSMWGPEPLLQNGNILAGTDPLPRSGEEQQIGRFGILVNETVSSTEFESKVWPALFDGNFEVVGNRNGWLESLRRYFSRPIRQ